MHAKRINTPSTFSGRTNPITSGERALTPSDYAKIMARCLTLEETLLIQLAVGLGLRRLDITRLKIADIDLVGAKLVYTEHKKRRTRVVPLPPQLAQTLSMYLNALGPQKRRTYLFAWGASTYGDRTAYNRLATLCDRAGIPRRPFHALRATCIKFCQRAGWTPEQTAKLVGDTLRVIQLHYTVPSDAELAEVAATRPIV